MEKEKTGKRLLQLWSKLGTGQKVSMGLSFGLVIIGTILLLVWAGRPRQQMLMSGIDAETMAEVTSALAEKAITYEIDESGTALYVSADNIHEARMHLASSGLPQSGGVGFEIFDRNNFGISSEVQRINYLRAVQGELARTITELDSVRNARVMIVIPENRLLADGENIQATASVFVETRPGALSREAVNSIRFLVANAVEGLDITNVAVVDNAGNVLSEKLDDDESLGTAPSKLKFKQSVEDYLAGKVETMLNRVLGPGRVIVRVSADIEQDSQTYREERYDPDGQVVRNQTTTEDKTVTTKTVDSQPVGAESNLAEEEEQASQTADVTSDEKINKTITYEINSTVTERVTEPGTIKRLTAAVFLDTPVTEVEGEAQPAPRSMEDLEQIRMIVANALGIVASGDELKSLVTIEELPFAAPPQIQPASIFDIPENIHFWMDLLRNGFALIIALVMFAVFFRMIKHQRSNIADLEIVDADTRKSLPAGTARPGGVVSGGGALEGGSKQQPTPEMLNELIREKPENVSIALKNWVSSPSKPSRK